jgi:hypothetical protein
MHQSSIFSAARLVFVRLTSLFVDKKKKTILTNKLTNGGIISKNQPIELLCY